MGDDGHRKPKIDAEGLFFIDFIREIVNTVLFQTIVPEDFEQMASCICEEMLLS
jgi:hypothetical protein